jgi:hypothetical protein
MKQAQDQATSHCDDELTSHELTSSRRARARRGADLSIEREKLRTTTVLGNHSGFQIFVHRRERISARQSEHLLGLRVHRRGGLAKASQITLRSHGFTAGPARSAVAGRLGRLAAYPWRAQALGNLRVTSRDTEHFRDDLTFLDLAQVQVQVQVQVSS